MNIEPKSNIAIVGAGIAGLTVGKALEDLGMKATIFEAANTIKGIGAEIGLASNAIKGFEYLGLVKQIKSIGSPIEEFSIFDPSGQIIFQVDPKRLEKTYQHKSYAVHRAELHQVLLKSLSNTEVYLSKRLLNFRLKLEKVQLFFSDGTSADFDYVIAADGIHSMIRKKLVPGSNERYAGYRCWRCITKVPTDFHLTEKALWGPQGRFGLKSMSQNRIYWFACINSPLDGAYTSYGLTDLQKHFKAYMGVSEVLKFSREEDVISDAIQDIKPLKKFFFDRILLLGDAAHATTPNMGQGSGMAVEDVVVLKQELEKNDIKIAFQNFERRRLKRTAYIIKNSRRAGRIAQLDYKVLCTFRDWGFRKLPAAFTQYPLRRLYDEDFLKIT